MQGRSIEGGMVYVGSEVLSVSGYWTEPSLIDPGLPVDWRHADWDGALIEDWPSYDRAHPRVRAAYLGWLAGGRRDKIAHIGYVLLFFYGLERRLLADIGADVDHPDVLAIIVEVRRLLDIYGHNRIFSRSATEFMTFIEGLLCLHTDIEPIPRDPERKILETPLAVRIGIGKYLAESSKVPAEWGLSYLHHHPGVKPATPARRCPDEFDELFLIRHRARFPDGMKVRRPAGKIDVSYRTASHGFDHTITFARYEQPRGLDLAPGLTQGTYGGTVHATAGNIPDIVWTDRWVHNPLQKLRNIAKQCNAELDAYSKFIGKNPGRGETAAALSLLPECLLASHGGQILDDLRGWASEVLEGGTTAVVPLDELVERWSPGHVAKLTKQEAGWLASMLARIGVGIEPDVRFGGTIPNPGTRVVLFRLPGGTAESPSDAYGTALPIVHVAAIVAGADGGVGPEQYKLIVERLEGIAGLDNAERRRLAAYVEFLDASRPGMRGMKHKAERIPRVDRAAIGSFLIPLAAADGLVSRQELTALEKVFGYLGLDTSDLYRRVHGLHIDDHGPVTVRDAQPTARWSVPNTGQVAARRPPVTLDPQKVRARLAETDRVSALLTDIFVDDAPIPTPEPSPTGLENGSVIGELDEAHSALMRKLVARSEWDRSSAERLAESVGLPFLDSALDVINETAMEACGEPVVEGDDPVVLNTYAVEELT